MKKRLLFLCVLFLMFALVGCGQTDEQTLNNYLDKITVVTEVEGDFHLPYNVDNKDDHSISWTSSDANIIRIGNIAEQNGIKTYTAKVTRSADDKTVTLTATVELASGSKATKDFTVTVKKDDKIVNPDPKPQFDTWPYEENKPYKFTLVHTKLNKTYYFTGNMDGFYLATTEKADKAVDVYCEKVDGGYKLFFTKDGVKNYFAIEMSADGKHTNAKFGADKNCVFTWDKSLQTMVTKIGDEIAFFGTSSEKEFTTIGGTKNTKPGAQCPVTLTVSDGKPIEPDPKPTPQPDEGWGVLNTFEAGKAYKFGLLQTNKDNQVIYLSGKLNEKNPWYLLTTTDKNAAANVTAVAVDGGYNIKVEGESGVKYINAKKDGTHYSIFLEDAAASVWTWDEAHKTFITTCVDKQVFVGTYQTYTTLSACTIDKFETNMVAHFYGETEGGEVNPDPKPTPQPDTVTEIKTIKTSAPGNFICEGIVYGKNAQSFLVGDGSDFILIYKGYEWDNTTVKVGDKVRVNGLTTEYGQSIQFDRSAEFNVLSSGNQVTLPTEVAFDKAKADSILANTKVNIEYLTFTGVVSFSTNDKGRTYFNLNVNGVDLVVSITYPIDEQLVMGLNGQTVTIKGFTTGLSGKTTKYLNVLVTDFGTGSTPTPQPEPTSTKIDAIIKGEEGFYKTAGTVIAKNFRSFIVADETGKILVYMGKNWDNTAVVVGDVVTLEGSVNAFMNAKQFDEKTIVTKTGTAEIKAEEATLLTKTELDTYLTATSVEIKLVKFVGALEVSGNYINILVPGTKLICQVNYPLNLEDLKALDGKAVELTAYIDAAGKKPYDSSEDIYANFMFVGIKEVEATNEIKFHFANNELLTTLDGKAIRENLVLPTSFEKYGLTYTWTSNNDAIKADGTYTVPQTDTEVKLTATVKAGETVLGTVEVTIIAKAAASTELGVHYEHIFAKGDLSETTAVTLSNLNWTFTNNGGYYGWDNNDSNKGIQIGSGSNPSRETTLLTNDYDGVIKTIVVNASMGSKGVGTLSVTVGNKLIKSVDLTKVATDYTFEVNASGEIKITISQPTTSKAVYFKYIKIN